MAPDHLFSFYKKWRNFATYLCQFKKKCPIFKMCRFAKYISSYYLDRKEKKYVNLSLSISKGIESRILQINVNTK